MKERNPYFELHELGHKTNTLPVFPGLKSKVKSQIMRGFPEVKGIICIGDHIIERTKGAYLRISTGDGVYRKQRYEYDTSRFVAPLFHGLLFHECYCALAFLPLFLWLEAPGNRVIRSVLEME